PAMAAQHFRPDETAEFDFLERSSYQEMSEVEQPL
ncbi:unnamed protein product, partial [marine sediment metagenome]